MKKIILKFVILSMSMILINSCTEDKHDGVAMWYSESFIEDIIIPLETKVAMRFDYGNVMFCGYDYTVGEEVGYRYGTAAEKRMYRERYGDTSYKNNIYIGQNRAIAPEPTAITVVCDKDFDTDHPAGTPLNDIIRLHSYSYHDFIRNGYKMRSRENYYPENFIDYRKMHSQITYHGLGLQPITMMLNDLNLDDLKLLASGFYLQILKTPAAGEYTYTVTVTTEIKTFVNTVTATYP